MTADNKKLKILFLCTGNSCRSQMAEGWARQLKGDEFASFSAGVETHGLNPHAVKVMAEVGVDISAQQSKLIDELPAMDFDYVVTLCDHAAEACPTYSGKTKVVHRSFPDPPKLATGAISEQEVLVHYRLVRDLIKKYVDEMPGNLE
ncbi:MAG: arsenate reductase ArsC [Proteobacteria bacterium]|nr:arsenate reductase ArsC [Pseudomonadota bacterium]MBU1717373.1 arsenate reductase ArsC [Pseudomonadota bacterium]